VRHAAYAAVLLVRWVAAERVHTTDHLEHIVISELAKRQLVLLLLVEERHHTTAAG